AGLLPFREQRLPQLADPSPPVSDVSLRDQSFEGRGQLREGRGRRSRYRQIAREAADWIAGEQRVDAGMDDLARGRRRLETRDPRDVAFYDEDRIGVVEIGRRVIAEMAGVVGGQAEMARTVLDDRYREAPS